MWTLLHAWHEWLLGHDNRHLSVFGIAVFWWGRIGKTLEFLGGLTVVMDLLGRERMEVFHATLRRRRARLFARFRRDRRIDDETARVSAVSSESAILRGFVIGGMVAMGLFLVAGNHYAGATGGDMPLPVLVLFVAVAAPTLGGVAGFLAYFAGLLLLELFVVMTLGQLKTREGLVSRLKWTGLWIFVVGFSMDMLSS
jgi:hypothetical protein